eukprot:COSAG01_NODE_30405_length_616_cov_1.883946_1_plen_56_part_10
MEVEEPVAGGEDQPMEAEPVAGGEEQPMEAEEPEPVPEPTFAAPTTVSTGTDRTPA